MRLVDYTRTLVLVCALIGFLAPIPRASSNERNASGTWDPKYRNLIASLQKLVNASSRSTRNHFFVSRREATAEHIYMVWREGKAVWILSAGEHSPDHWDSAILLPRGGTRIDLVEDVVPTTKEIGTSTYLVAQPWANAIVYDAVVNGDMIVVEKAPTR